MKRRAFLGSCSLLAGIAPLACAQSAASSEVRSYARTRLVDIHGSPIRYAAIEGETNYVFQYPFAATPCFLLRLAAAVKPASSMRREQGPPYVAPGGIGPKRDLVAFSAICAHKLMYPTAAISFIGLRSGGRGEPAHVIHCCGDNSRYDPSQGARVIDGPAPQPLAAVLLEWDAGSDQLHAVGTRGGERFDAFFEKYATKLQLETGSGVRKPSGATAIVQPAASYSRQWHSCS